MAMMILMMSLYGRVSKPLDEIRPTSTGTDNTYDPVKGMLADVLYGWF